MANFADSMNATVKTTTNLISSYHFVMSILYQSNHNIQFTNTIVKWNSGTNLVDVDLVKS